MANPTIDPLKISPEKLRQVQEDGVKDLAKSLSKPLSEIQKLQRELASKPEMSDPDNFARKILIDRACQDFKAIKVQGSQDLTSCKSRSTSDGIRAIFSCGHPLAEASIRDNLHVAELKMQSPDRSRNIRGVTFQTGAVIFKDISSDEYNGRQRYIANEGTHQILNSRTTKYNGEYYKNIFHFESTDSEGRHKTPRDLVKLFEKHVPAYLAEGLSFKDSSQVHELISDCASSNTSTYDLDSIIANSLSKPSSNKNCADGYSQTNLFAAKQAIKYLNSLPKAETENEHQIRGAAIEFLRSRVKDGPFKETPHLNLGNEKVPAYGLVCMALGDDGLKFIQKQYLQLGRSLISAIVEHNTKNPDKTSS